jgi:hypothetical protein
MRTSFSSLSCFAILLAVAIQSREAAAQARRIDPRPGQSVIGRSATVTPTTGSRAQPSTTKAQVDLLQRVLETQRLNETALATPVKLTPSRPNQVDRLYANLRSGTTITGPTSDEAWLLTPATGGWGPQPVSWQNTRLFSGETPLADLFGNPRLTLTIRRAVLKSKALVECGVTAQSDGQLAMGGSIPAQTIAIKNGSQHLDVVVEAPASTSEDVELFLEPQSMIAVNYCEITALKY